MVLKKGYRKQNATYADLQQLSDNEVGQILYGELIVSPRPAGPHAYAERAIAGSTTPFARKPGTPGGPGGWWILIEPQLKFRDDCFPVPDLAGWRRERMPAGPRDTVFELAPDWICEILSPSTQKYDRTTKMDIYGDMGVEYVWLVDPIERTLEAYQRSEGWQRLDGQCDDAKVRIAPFEAVEIDLSEWWLPDVDGQGPL